MQFEIYGSYQVKARWTIIAALLILAVLTAGYLEWPQVVRKIGGGLMASVIPLAFLYFLGWGATSRAWRMRLKEVLAQANGWQRIFAVTAGVWTLVCGLVTLVFLTIAFVGYFFEEFGGGSLGGFLYAVGATLGLGLLFAVIPSALLYALGYAVAWIRRGFQDNTD